MRVRLLWSGGGEATVVSVGADTVVLRSTVSAPPGSRLDGSLRGEPGAMLKVKVHGCKRQPEGDFVIEARPIDLTREVRDRLGRT